MVSCECGYFQSNEKIAPSENGGKHHTLKSFTSSTGPMSYENDAYRYAIRNAFDHKGKADAGALIGKLKALYPDMNVKELVPYAKDAVEKVNNMGMDEIHAEFDKFSAEGFELKIPEKKGGLQELEWAANEPVVTRYAPNPSAPGHLGHLRPAILSYLYAKKYHGKFILRFDDTDPKLKKPIEGGEQMYLDDLKWFGIVPDVVTRASDRFEVYDDYMTQIVQMGKAYLCTCDKEEWKAKILKHEACPCRELSVEEQMGRLQKFFKHEYKQGEVVLRIKTSLTHEDPSQRDWPLARIVDKPLHYLVKGRYVWPTYNFASAIDDHLMGVTLIIRGQEHYQNMLKQKWLYAHFGWEYPHAFHHGRMLMPGAELSKSKMIAGIASGKFSGWDDPKLFTIRALQRKGFTPQGLQELIVDLGVKTSDTVIDLQLLGTFNKPHVDKSSNFTLIVNPTPLEVDFGPELDVKVDDKIVHLKQGRQPFFVSKEDAQKWSEGTTIRLRNAYIAKINFIDEYHVNAQFISTKKLENTSQINWLPEGVDVQIVMPDGTITFGLAEAQAGLVHVNDEVHFQNIGFCRVDEKTDKEIKLWFTHP